MATPLPPYQVTPDRRYFVLRGRLWLMANPELPELKRVRHHATQRQPERRGLAVMAEKFAVALVDRPAAAGLGGDDDFGLDDFFA